MQNSTRVLALGASLLVALTMCSSEEGKGDFGEPDAGAQTGPAFTLGEDVAYLSDGGLLGRVLADGAVVDEAGEVVGEAKDGTVYDLDGKPIGSVETTLNGEPVQQSECIEEKYAGESVPVDIYIMFDQSGSMLEDVSPTETRLDAVRSAIGQFLNDRGSNRFGAGIGYFGYQTLGEPLSCAAAEYAKPAVEIAALPGNASNMINSLSSIVPTGETPTGAAIRGACDYATEWHDAHRSHVVVILLVTDGVPQAPISEVVGGCIPTLADAKEAAGACLTEGVSTYVLGVGPSLGNLNDIAASGGTKSAHLVEGGDVATQVLDALKAIRGAAAVPCEFSLPTPPSADQTIDFGKVNLTYTDPDGKSERLFAVDSEADCDPAAGAWHYDNAASPTRIQLCGSICEDVKRPGSSIDVELGCTTQVLIK